MLSLVWPLFPWRPFPRPIAPRTTNGQPTADGRRPLSLLSVWLRGRGNLLRPGVLQQHHHSLQLAFFGIHPFFLEYGRCLHSTYLRREVRIDSRNSACASTPAKREGEEKELEEGRLGRSRSRSRTARSPAFRPAPPSRGYDGTNATSSAAAEAAKSAFPSADPPSA